MATVQKYQAKSIRTTNERMGFPVNEKATSYQSAFMCAGIADYLNVSKKIFSEKKKFEKPER